MPAAIPLVLGGASVWGGAVAWGVAGSGLATFAAGAMIVGGAAQVIGGAMMELGSEKDKASGKKLAEIGGYVALAGGITTGLGHAGALGDGFAKAVPVSAAASGSGVANPEYGNPGHITPSSTPAPALDANAAYQKSANQMMLTNTIAQTVGGAGQAYGGYAQSEAQKESAATKLAEDKRIVERDYANRNNLTGLKIPYVRTPQPLTQAVPRGV